MNHNNVMGLIGYVFTLATFFNSFRTEYEADSWERTVIPSKFVFHYARRMDNIDNLSKVNNNLVKKYFDKLNAPEPVPEEEEHEEEHHEHEEEHVNEPVDLTNYENIELDFPENDGFGTFFDHCYAYPQCMTEIKHSEDKIFFDPHNIKWDLEPSQAFIATIHALKPVLETKDYRLILDKLNILDSFEIKFLKRDANEYQYHPESFANQEEAQQCVNSVLVPDEIRNDKVVFVCMIKYVVPCRNGTYDDYVLELFYK